MRFKKGYQIKPDSIKTNGLVLFTDGTNNEILPNKDTCLAYGYKYIDGVCVAFSPSVELLDVQEKGSTINNGSNNITRRSNGILINGSNHITVNASGCLISGQNNEISQATEIDGETFINNSSVIGGKLGKSSHTGEIVIGGGNGDGSLAGQNQMSIISLSGETRGSDVTLYIQGDTTKEEEIYLPNNSIVIFDLRISGICTGGAEGTPGHYKTLVQTGTCLVDNEGAVTYNAGTTTTTASFGDTGTIVIDATTTANIFSIQIGGDANLNVRWNAVVKLYINQTIAEI